MLVPGCSTVLAPSPRSPRPSLKTLLIVLQEPFRPIRIRIRDSQFRFRDSQEECLGLPHEGQRDPQPTHLPGESRAPGLCRLARSGRTTDPFGWAKTLGLDRAVAAKVGTCLTYHHAEGFSPACGEDGGAWGPPPRLGLSGVRAEHLRQLRQEVREQGEWDVLEQELLLLPERGVGGLRALPLPRVR